MSSLRRWSKAAALTLGPLLRARFQPRRVILCYHSVHPSRPFRSMTPELFAGDLTWLRNHCDVVPLRTLVAERAIAGGRRPQVAITFDDGHVDNYHYALPLLIEHGMSATFYVTTGYLNRHHEVMARFACLLRTTSSELQPLSWGQVRELAATGMEVGAHTFSHPNLAHLETKWLAREIVEPKAEIEGRLGVEIDSFAYPFGQLQRHVNKAAIAAVQGAGFKTAVTTNERGVRPRESVFALPRLMSTASVEVLAKKLRGDWDLIGFVQQCTRAANPTT